MKKSIAIGTAFAVALGLAACEPAPETTGGDEPEATEAVVDEPATDDVAQDGTMTDETGTDEAAETAGPDHDGNTVDH